MDLKEFWSKNLQKIKLSLPLHLLTNFEIQKGYYNVLRFNGVYSRDNLPGKIRDAKYAIHLDEYDNIWTHWIALYALNNIATCFDSFGVEHIPKEIKKFINKSTITTDIFSISFSNERIFLHWIYWFYA